MEFPKKKNVNDRNPCSFKTKELNNFLSGGFNEGSTVLLAGSSGTGKTVFSMQWIFEGAKYFNDVGLYITLTEPISEAESNLNGLKFYDPELLLNRKVVFMDLRDMLIQNRSKKKVDKGNYQILLKLIEDLVRKTGAKRLVIDSITAICLLLGDQNSVRSFIFNLGTILKTLKCTSILTSEIQPDQKGYSLFGIEEFISDVLIRIEHTERKNTTMRTLQLLKLRGKEIKSPLRNFQISNKGIVVIPSFSLHLEQPPPNKRIGFGVPKLDKMCNGGLWVGSSTLISGASGTGKSNLGLHFIMEGLKNKENCTLIAYEESLVQIKRNAKSFGWDLDPYINKGFLNILVSYPEDKPLVEHLKDLTIEITKNKSKRVVIDSLSRIAGTAVTKREYGDFLKRLNAYIKKQGITVIYNYTSSGIFGKDLVSQSNISTITDSIIMLQYVELEGRIIRVISIVKLRGSDHDKNLREYSFKKEGFVLGKAFNDVENMTTGVARRIGHDSSVTGLMRQMYEIREKFENKEITVAKFNDRMQEIQKEIDKKRK